MNRRRGALRSMWNDVDGVRVHAVASIDPVPAGTPTVVLVHGLGLSHRYMDPTAELLACDFRVYTPDLPGFGDSGKPARVLDVPGLADALAGWMRAAGLQRAALLGNSFGCQIIADLAARHPDLVERAILQGPTTPPERRTWLRQFIHWRRNAPYNPPELGRITHDDYRKAGLSRLFWTTKRFLSDRVEDKLPRIRAPVLVVRGALDPIVPQQWAETVTSLLPRGRLVIIPDVAHTLVYTSPRELTEASRPFLEEGRRPPPAGRPATAHSWQAGDDAS